MNEVPTGQGVAGSQQSFVGAGAALLTEGQPAETIPPRQGALDYPPVPAQAPAGLNASAGDAALCPAYAGKRGGGAHRRLYRRRIGFPHQQTCDPGKAASEVLLGTLSSNPEAAPNPSPQLRARHTISVSSDARKHCVSRRLPVGALLYLFCDKP